MPRRGPLAIILDLVKALFIFIDATYFTNSVTSLINILPTFLTPGHESFWDDVIAHHLKSENCKSNRDFYEVYDRQLVRDYVVEKRTDAGHVPSEKSTLAFAIDMSLAPDRETPQLERDRYFREWVRWMVLEYLPVALFLFCTVKAYTWAACRSPRAILRYEEYYEGPFYRRVLAILATLPAVIALSVWNAYATLTPDFTRAGYTIWDLALLFFLLSYLSSVSISFVQSVIASTFILCGRDPEKTHWDEVITVLVTAPVLLFVFNNSAISLASDLIAGIGPMLLYKLWRRRVNRTPEILEVRAIEDDPAHSLLRYRLTVILMACSGVFLAGCCSIVSLTSARTTPETATLAQVENGWKSRGINPWVEWKGGYLFWPAKFRASMNEEMDIRPGEGLSREDYWVVPFLSREVCDEWTKEYQEKGGEAKYSYSRCHVFALFPPDELAVVYPNETAGQYAPDKPYTETTLRGNGRSIKSIHMNTKKAMNAEDAEFPATSLWVIQVNGQTSSMGLWVIPLIGVSMIVPAFLRLFVGWPYPPREPRFRKNPIEPVRRPPARRVRRQDRDDEE